jgi:hypothetical protein
MKDTLKQADIGMKRNFDNLQKVADEARRVADTTKNVHIIITDLDRQFEKATKLTKIDISFLFFAVALQVARQYFLTNFREREGHNEAAGEAKEAEKRMLGKETPDEALNRKGSTHSWYQPSLQEVTFNPVPFDQTLGIEGLGGGFEHRAKTLGHDPVLGYIFGTANIATATLTTWELQSFHVKYTGTGILKPTVTNNARTDLVFQYTKERLLDQGPEGKAIVAIALFREAMHLKSDVNSKKSLPFPFVSSAISPEFAKELAKYGLDIANIGTIAKQALYSIIINTFIAMIHRLLYNEDKDGTIKLYEVRTRKIVSYSNVIASASNIIAVGIAAAIGVAANNQKIVNKSLSYLDIGGLVVTLYRIITDYNFIKQIKMEFLEKGFYDTVMGNDFDF